MEREKCLEGWIEWNETCYFFEQNSRKEWNEGRTDCVKKSKGGGDLVSIHSQEENDFVFYMSKGYTVWIGLYLKSNIHAG